MHTIFSKKNVLTPITVLGLVGMLALPFVAGAAIGDPNAGGLVPCDGPGCDLGDFIQLINNVINFAFMVVPFLAAIAFAIAGFYYITSAGSEQRVSQAHQIFQNTFIGIIVVLAAWLIVKAILAGLGANNFVSQFFA